MTAICLEMNLDRDVESKVVLPLGGRLLTPPPSPPLRRATSFRAATIVTLPQVGGHDVSLFGFARGLVCADQTETHIRFCLSHAIKYLEVVVNTSRCPLVPWTNGVRSCSVGPLECLLVITTATKVHTSTRSTGVRRCF